MSSASNLGFSKDPIYSGLQGSPNVNATSSNYSGNFTSTTIPSGPHSHTGISNNVAAAAASQAGGGSGRKKYNIGRKYRMKKRGTQRYRKRSQRRSRKCRYTRRRRGGGYLSYMSNNPSSTTMKTAAIPVGPGTGNPIGMANPPTFDKWFSLPGGMKGGGSCPLMMKGGSCDGSCPLMMKGGATTSPFNSAPTINCNGCGNNYNHFTGKCVGPLTS